LKYKTKMMWVNLFADGRVQSQWETKKAAIENRNSETASIERRRVFSTEGEALPMIPRKRQRACSSSG